MLTIDITVALAAVLTRRAVTVTNPETGTVTKTGVLRIT